MSGREKVFVIGRGPSLIGFDFNVPIEEALSA